MAQNYANNSFYQFLSSGRSSTIAKKILQFLLGNEDDSFTASELQRNLEIKYRSSLCYPLKKLIDIGLIDVVKSKFDYETGREVGSYGILKGLIDSDTNREVSLYQLSKIFLSND